METAFTQAPARAVWNSLENFLGWLEREGYASYDPYDIWGTRYGVLSRRLYYRHNLLGLPAIAPIVSLEVAWPGLRRLFVRKQRYPTADAQLALGFANLYEYTGRFAFLEEACQLGR